MKKTLVALAVLAASGASFAQASITGNYTFGYKQSQSAGAAAKSGIGTDTAAVQFVASEDLGGGLKATARVSIANASREAQGAGTNPYIKGEDAYVAISGGFGTVKFQTFEAANGLLAIGSSGASGFGLDGSVISGSSNLDGISYAVPLTSAVTLGVGYTDVAELGVGSSGTAAGQSSVTAGVTYSAAPLSAKIDTTSYLRNGDTDVTSNAGQSRYRLSAAYDLGVARLSAGLSRKSSSGDVVDNEMLVGVAVPMGKTTLGLDYATANKDTAGTKSAEKSGYSLGASYALSKRTSVSASYLAWTTKGTDGTNTGFRTFVSHSF